MTLKMSPFDEVEPAWEAAFEQAWMSWRAGSMAIGAVIVDRQGTVVATGRNRVLEAAGSGPLAGALIAHAEMDAFASLGLRTGDDLSLYTTMSPCLMCTASSIALRIANVLAACDDPVFDGLDDALIAHPYCMGRIPQRGTIDHPALSTLARLLPMTVRVWSRPGVEPRPEWLQRHAGEWRAANDLVESGILTKLADSRASIRELYRTVEPIVTECANAARGQGV